MAHRKAIATLYTSSDVAVAKAKVTNVTWSADSGWTWAAQASSAISLYLGRFATFYIVLTDGTDTITTPPLVWTPRSRTSSRSIASPALITMGGVDEKTFRLRKNNQSFASFRGVESTAVIDALAERAGIVINNPPALYFSEEEIKNERLSSAFSRALGAAAYDSLVNLDGEIDCTAWEADPGDLSFVVATEKHDVDPTEIFTGVRGGKRSSMPEAGEQEYEWEDFGFVANVALTEPLHGPAVAEWIQNKTLGYVDFYDAADERVAYYSYHPDYASPPPAATGSGPATYFNITLRPTEGIFALLPYMQRIIVVGTPEDDLPPGVDAEFLYPVPVGDPDTSLGSWPPESDSIDSLYESEAYFISRQAYILAKMCSAADTLTLTGRFQCGAGVRPLKRYVYDGDPDEVEREFKAWSIAWNPEGNETVATCRRVTPEAFPDDE